MAQRCATLELARIGSLLFIFADSPNDQNGSSSSIDTFATRLSAQPLRSCFYGREALLSCCAFHFDFCCAVSPPCRRENRVERAQAREVNLMPLANWSWIPEDFIESGAAAIPVGVYFPLRGI